MARHSNFYILPLFFAVAILTVLYISWADLSSCMSLPLIPRTGSKFWDDLPTVPPTTTDPPGLTAIPILHRKNYSKLPQWDFDDKYKTDRRDTRPHSIVRAVCGRRSSQTRS
ncbi:hypothetical protein WMY93_010129 [Mugilogobius chulae]|uniref:Uncharacterized protein n=1 Tax=Mugilogobius chulae TaxID=88201 RepID=A0AAW0P6X6_9GOBI